MDLKIIEKKEEPLLSRTKLIGEIVFEASTPSHKEIKKKISSSLNSDEKLIVIKNIYTKFGIKKANFLAYIYNNEKSMKEIEPKPKEKAEKSEKPEEKPAEKTEKPKEEKETKEEKKESKKEEKQPEAKKEKK